MRARSSQSSSATSASGTSAVAQKQDAADLQLRYKKAWEAAIAPAKSIPMQGIMMWMSGNSVQIFSMMILVMMVSQPVRAIMSVNQQFERFQRTQDALAKGAKAVDLTVPKLAFVGIQVFILLIAVYKCQSMGLLPFDESNWLAFLQPPTFLEIST
ncbi:DUF1077-domain-containing protein [Ramicandelaber brevisporus]|nr:DUF1077-domain-containing protein [Ramicandelaber brevisporus]